MSASVCRLGDQTTIIMGQSPPGDSYNKEHAGVPLLNGPTEFGPIHPTEKQWTTAPTKLCEAGDALFCVRGATAGRLNVADKTYCLGRGLAAIRGKPGKFDAGFLLHILRNGYAKFQARGVGSTFINISSEELSQFEVPALPLTEQRRIAEVLDRAEALRAKRRAALAQLDTLTQSIFLDLFGDPATNSKAWPMTELEEVSEFENGDRSANYPSGDEVRREGILFLSTKNIVDEALNLSEAVFISEEKFRSLSRGKARRNDLIITLRGTLGSCCIFDCKYETAFINAQMMIIRPKVAGTDKYLHALMTSSRMKDHFARVGYGAAIRQLSSSLLSRLAIPFPDVSLQREFARRVATVEKLKTLHRAGVAELDEFFAVLQHRAFRGEL